MEQAPECAVGSVWRCPLPPPTKSALPLKPVATPMYSDGQGHPTGLSAHTGPQSPVTHFVTAWSPSPRIWELVISFPKALTSLGTVPRPPRCPTADLGVILINALPPPAHPISPILLLLPPGSFPNLSLPCLMPQFRPQSPLTGYCSSLLTGVLPPVLPEPCHPPLWPPASGALYSSRTSPLPRRTSLHSFPRLRIDAILNSFSEI